MSSMRGMMLAGVLVLATGCAHRWDGDPSVRDIRGSAELGVGARLLLAGPARSVHANVEGGDPTALYLVDRVSGEDRDCAKASTAGAAAFVPQRGDHIDIPAGRELCATHMRAGVTEVVWHARVAAPTDLVSHHQVGANY